MRSDGAARRPWDRCSLCYQRQWRPFILDPPLGGYFVWVRCGYCGNIAASAPLLMADSRTPQGLTHFTF